MNMLMYCVNAAVKRLLCILMNAINAYVNGMNQVKLYIFLIAHFVTLSLFEYGDKCYES
jgi:hypothetical protein